MNKALLSKLGWSVAINEDKPWVKYLSVKYLRGKSFWNVKARGEASWVWKSILSIRETLSKGACWKISTALGVNIWNATWIPKSNNFKPISRVQGVQPLNWDFELILSNLRRWDEEKLALCFKEESARNIKNI